MAQILAFPRAKVHQVPSGPRTTDDRPRDFLTEAEMVLLLKAAHQSRYGPRDAAMFLLAYRHGLRVSELVGMRLAQLDLAEEKV